MAKGNDGDRPFTKLVTGGRRPEWTGAAVNVPVWRASTVLYDSVAEMRARPHDTHHKPYYGRRGMATQWSLAEALTELEPGAAGTLLYPSGVAAVATALMTILAPGDELLMVDSAYEPSRAFCDGPLKRMGIATRYYDPCIGGGIVDMINERTAVIFLESPGSITFEVQDVPAIVAAAKDAGVVTMIDNTWATPLLLPVIEMGVDLSIMALTKYVVGHSDAMLGSVTAAPSLWQRLRQTTHVWGQCASPDDAWLGARGLRTMGVRLKQHEASALAVAHWLDERPEVERVLHPALPSCPGHAVWARDFRGSSGLFSFVLQGGDDAARTAMLDGLRLFGLGYSWGGYESLAIPADPERMRSAVPWIADGPLVRLHIGLEDPEDLIADLEAGLGRFVEVRDRS